jgi:uncharacterized protein YpmB
MLKNNNYNEINHKLKKRDRFLFFLKKKNNYTVIVQRDEKNNKKLILYPRGDSTQSCATLCSRGVSQRIFSMQGGISKKKYYKGITKHPYFAGGKSYLN